jgi:general secretion pathway protein A
MDRVLLFGFLENLSGITSEHIAKVMTEVSNEMFTPEEMATHVETTPPVSTINTSSDTVVSESAQDAQDSSLAPLNTQENFLDTKMLTDKPLTSEERKALLEQEVDYYKTMLNELVDALDDAITHKVKLTQYIDKLLKKKYKSYVRLKEDE